MYSLLKKNNAGQTYFDAIYSGRNDFQPKVRAILQKYGDIPIVGAEIRRTPLSTVMMATLSVASFGKIDKNNPYDKLFHLCMVVELEGGVQILIEKNEVINMEVNTPVRPNTQSRQIDKLKPSAKLTIKQMMQNTKDRMGSKFHLYSARDCNCQDFIRNVLIANRLDTPELLAFVKQDTRQVFEGLTYLRKGINSLTDFASRLNVIKEGAGQPDLIVPHSGLSLRNGLYSDEVEEILHDAGVKNFGGVYSKDRLPTTLKKGWWYIINLENFADGNGTHYACFKYGKNIEYYDSIGFPPPLQVLKLKENAGNIKWSNKQIQDLGSTACGWYCIARITSKLPYKKFIDKFSSDTFMNDKILKQMLTDNGVEC